eukprot:GHVU01012873.1.p1 GENE.GHVU01012873.1~~GHVU01012873.1.p1  ORF type:complete len:252 (+),score=15.23 GHVU01012873.1:188-943(+)
MMSAYPYISPSHMMRLLQIHPSLHPSSPPNNHPCLRLRRCRRRESFHLLSGARAICLHLQNVSYVGVDVHTCCAAAGGGGSGGGGVVDQALAEAQSAVLEERPDVRQRWEETAVEGRDAFWRSFFGSKYYQEMVGRGEGEVCDQRFKGSFLERLESEHQREVSEVLEVVTATPVADNLLSSDSLYIPGSGARTASPRRPAAVWRASGAAAGRPSSSESTSRSGACSNTIPVEGLLSGTGARRPHRVPCQTP